MLNFYKILQQEKGEKLLILSRYSIDVENDLHNSTVEIPLTKLESEERDAFGKKVLQRFASEIMADQVHSDSFRNVPKLEAEVFSQEVKDPNQLELPLSGATTATQVAEEKPKRSRKAKVATGIDTDVVIEKIKNDTGYELSTEYSLIENVVRPSRDLTEEEKAAIAHAVAKTQMYGAESATIETVMLTIDDLRTAVQACMTKNGKSEVAAQTAKLKTLFASYGGSDVSTFPKNKIAECITKIQSL